jgi:predicted transcriptional regulator
MKFTRDFRKMETDEILLIKHLLLKKPEGLSITELVELSKLSRSAVRTILAQLEGANQVSMRNIGMAKLYSFKKEAQELNENSHSADSSI